MIGVLVSGEGTNLQALIDAGLPDHLRREQQAGRTGARASRAGRDRDRRLPRSRSTPTGTSATRRWPPGWKSTEPRLVVCAGYMHLLRPTFLDRFAGRIVNTHSAPLPEFPGARPIEDVLEAGVPETAATVHYVDEGVDSGPVIATERVPVLAGDDVSSLRARVQAVEHRLLPEVVRELIRDQARADLGLRQGRA